MNTDRLDVKGFLPAVRLVAAGVILGVIGRLFADFDDDRPDPDPWGEP